MAIDEALASQLKPLDITCTSTDCENGLHCFKQTRRMRCATENGRCRACGVALVDWQRVHRRDPADASYTFVALKYELIRHHYWHVEIDEMAVAHARRKGRTGMRLAADKRIRRSIGSAQPSFDGRQTPKDGNALYYAQHATASCCRKCLEEWHGIPLGWELTEKEISYLVDLIMLYIDERLPLLTENGETIPRARHRPGPSE